jgi:hypothetical protein
MECQVNVAEDDGEQIQGEFRGRSWYGYEKDGQIWKSFRIPYSADSNPNFDTTSKMSFSLEDHAEAIGMTGWNWVKKRSIWVAYDFDKILGKENAGKTKLTDAQMKEVEEQACAIPWVTVRRSTSGTGLHLYVFLKNPVETNTHNEHAALARSILSQMSAECGGFNFHSKVDVCGGNMWVWHRKMMKTDGLSITKKAIEKFDNVPLNWKSHEDVITGESTKSRDPRIGDSTEHDILFGKMTYEALSKEHKKLIDYLESARKLRQAQWYWDSDGHFLRCHTKILEAAHEALNMKGIFKTNSPGQNLGEPNCFAYPQANGSWYVYRYGQGGVEEHPSWIHEHGKYTRTVLNEILDFDSGVSFFGGEEDPKTGGYAFHSQDDAVSTVQALGDNIVIPLCLKNRSCMLRKHKDGRIIFSIKKKKLDEDSIEGWVCGRGWWEKILKIKMMEHSNEITDCDDLVRNLVNENQTEVGWRLKTSQDKWTIQNTGNIRKVLQAEGYPPSHCDQIMGRCIKNPWYIVSRPFEVEYPGNRRWNSVSVQFTKKPSKKSLDELHYPHWMKIFDHVGDNLTEFVKKNEWCRKYGILTGGSYLKCWLASVVQYPHRPLPYLFFYSEDQNTGKSTFHEKVKRLFTMGVTKADSALTNDQGFNGELEGAIIAYVEETNLGGQKSERAYNRIKEWVTNEDIMIHPKSKTPYIVQNTLHFIQTANYAHYCPIFKGDTRITVIKVNKIPKEQWLHRETLDARLDDEAADFLCELISIELPPPLDRLNVPIIITHDKNVLEQANSSQLEAFLEEQCIETPGAVVSYKDFYNTFYEWLDDSMKITWGQKTMISKYLPPKYPKGRLHADNGNIYIGNLSFKFEPQEAKEERFILSDKNFLIPSCQ